MISLDFASSDKSCHAWILVLLLLSSWFTVSLLRPSFGIIAGSELIISQSSTSTTAAINAEFVSSTEPLSTPIFRNGTFSRLSNVPGTPPNHWWMIDYWNNWNYYGSFTAVSNSITGLSIQNGDAVLILPMNLAYGSSSNWQWFQFDIQFSADGSIWWGIWNVDSPGSSDSNYHPHTIGLAYTVGHVYHYQGSLVQWLLWWYFRFQIWDDSAGTNWYMDFSIPSTSQLYASGAFSPASAVEGYTTPSTVSNVPYYQFTVGYGMTSFTFGQYGSGVPSGIATDRQNLGGTPSTWHWEMISTAGHSVTFRTNPTSWSGTAGSIQVDGGTSYTNGQSATLSSGSHTYTVSIPSNYGFLWVAGNKNPPQNDASGVYVPNISTSSGTFTVDGTGWLKATFTAQITFNTNPSSGGSISYGGHTYTNGQTTMEANLPPDYGNTVTITASPPSGYVFSSWSTTGMLSVSGSTLTVNGPGTLTANFVTLTTIVYTLYTSTTTSATSISYTSTTIITSQQSTTWSTTSLLSTSYSTTTTTTTSGSVSTTYTARTTLYSTSSSPYTTTSTTTGTSTYVTTDLSKTGTVTVFQTLGAYTTTIGYTIYVTTTVQETFIEQWLQRITSTLTYWITQITQITQNMFVNLTVKDTVVQVKPERQPSSITLLVDGGTSASKGYGSSFVLSGSITPSTVGSVSLQLSLDGGASWSPFMIVSTGVNGQYSLSWTSPYVGVYLLKANWPGNADYFGSESNSPYPTVTVTGPSPPKITLLISGPSSVASGGSVTFDVLADNPGSATSTTLYFEVTGPGGYRYFDTQQVTLTAGRGRFQFVWQVPSAINAGQYQVFVSLIPPKPTAIAQTQITVQ